jgi:hypothetical protein
MLHMKSVMGGFGVKVMNIKQLIQVMEVMRKEDGYAQ